MAKKTTPTAPKSKAFARRAVDRTVIIVALVSIVASLALYFLVARGMASTRADLGSQTADLTLSSDDLRTQLTNAAVGRPDSVTQAAQNLKDIQSRLATFNTDVTPNLQAVIDGIGSQGTQYDISLMNKKGEVKPSGTTKPSDFYNGSGNIRYVRYKLDVSADSSEQLSAFAAAANGAPTLLTIVDPNIAYTPPAAAGAGTKTVTDAKAAKPWKMTGELWVWGKLADGTDK